MPAPAPFSPPQPSFPALYLYPLNDSFVPKHITLAHGQHVKIGRQTNAKTTPGERNGYFDSKVLSRQHAEVWEEAGKIYIKDVKSSNGTFINGERLSIEAVESEPYELKSDDIVEFGIDIVGEDNKTIIHHKVAARVLCVFSEQDAQVAARAEQHQQQHQQQFQQSAPSLMNQAGPSGINGQPSTFNFNGGQQRRPQPPQQGLAGMGGMGGSMRPPGKSGLSFDVILSRLQGELQKSRETGAELNTLTGAMNDIHETLGGGGPPANLPSYPALPPVRPPQDPSIMPSSSGSPVHPSTAASAAVSTSAIIDLQSQLRETQSSLSSHLEKIRALEGVLAEQETMKREVKTLREMVESRRREMEMEDTHKSHPEDLRGGFDSEDEGESGHGDDDDDARSINTVVPHELERVDEEDEEQLAEEERRHREHEEAEREEEHEALERERQHTDLESMGRPRTPEPIRMGLRDGNAYDLINRSSSSLLNAPRRGPGSSPLSKIAAAGPTTNDVYEQVMQLSIQVNAVMALTSTLEAQHTAAQSTIQALEGKVESLEAMLKATQEAQAQQARASSPSPPSSPPPSTPAAIEADQNHESLTEMLAEWKKSVEGQWSSVQEEWKEERERLSKAREEWETKVRQVDSGLEKMATLQSSTIALQQQHLQIHLNYANGDAVKHNGLVTPPSPRSQSSDSGRYRRRRRRSSGSNRGRSPSRSRSGSRERGLNDDDAVGDLDVESDAPPEETIVSKLGLFSSPNSPRKTATRTTEHGQAAARTLVTPEPTLYNLSTSPSSSPGSVDAERPVEDDTIATTEVVTHIHNSTINMHTALGVLVLSVAAAAVFWKVKPE